MVSSSEQVRGPAQGKEPGTYLDYGPEPPAGYGVTRIVLLVRDPECLYAYWEVAETHPAPPYILRLFNRTRGTETPTDLSRRIGREYFAVEPDMEYETEIGLRHEAGFTVLAHSNRVRTPRRGPSGVVDEEWMPNADQWELLRALAGGVERDLCYRAYRGASIKD